MEKKRNFSSSVSRDTLGMAVKATNAVVNENLVAIFKDPKTDDGSKKSAKGYLKVEKDQNGTLFMTDKIEHSEEARGLLRTVFINGTTPYLQTFEEIRQLANQ